MIGSLHGTVEIFDGLMVLINVGGVGYRVHVPQQVLTNYHLSQPIDLYIYSHIREDMFDLYGFIHLGDLKLFEALISVSGIGPKTALGIFALGDRDLILSAIQRADVTFFTGVPRLGKKNAQKVIIELKGKLGNLNELNLSGDANAENNEVIDALKNFGFSQKEAEDALRVIGSQDITTSQKVKMALKYLGK